MKKLIKILLIAFVIRLVLAFLIWHPDVRNHMDWGIRFWEYGPAKFYSANVWSFTWPNQPPGTMYLFAGVRKFYEFVFSIFWWVNIKIPLFPSGIITYLEDNLYPALLQLPAILADLGIAWLIYKIVKNKKLAVLGAIVFLINPVVWYNSGVWGQYDSVINFFVLLSLYFLLQKKLLPSVLAFGVSLYTKASLAVFLPIFAVVALKQKHKLTVYLKSFIVLGLIIGLVTLPFSRGEPFSWLYLLFKDKVFTQQLHVITANAFNLWAGLTGIHEQPNTLMLGVFSYETWGNILFTFLYLPALYLVNKKQDLKSIAWALSITAFATFMLLTNMHERYLYPLFPIFTILAVMDKKLLKIYWAISILGLLNLYNFWFTPRIETIVSFLSFSDRLMPRVLGFINFGLFLYLFNQFVKLLPAKKKIRHRNQA